MTTFYHSLLRIRKDGPHPVNGSSLCNMWRRLLAFICFTGLVGCAASTAPRDPGPGVTIERVTLSPADVDAAITPANAFYLSAREREVCANKAKNGDIEAARKLVRFYFTNHEGIQRTVHDDEKYRYWEGVVNRLDKTARKAKRENSRASGGLPSQRDQ